MNTFGLDYQQTLSVLYLREGEGLFSVERPVGDGQRAVFPNAVAETVHTREEPASVLWASAALQTVTAATLRQGEPDIAGAWLERPGAERFWCGVRERLFRYLGSFEPSFRNGYRTVAALPDTADETRHELKRIADAAGLEISPLDFISSTDALLCRWSSQRGALDQNQDAVVAVVAAGDTTTQVTAYGIRASAGRIAKPYARSMHSVVLPHGHSRWSEDLRRDLNQRLPEPLAPRFELAMRDACLEFASRLRTSGSRERQMWVGPGRSFLSPPVEDAPIEYARWESVQSFGPHLTAAIAESTQYLSGSKAPDLIIVGGVGATWPFPASVASSLAPVWQSGVPEVDIASGAAWWPVVGEGERLISMTYSPRLPSGNVREEKASRPAQLPIDTLPMAAMPSEILWFPSPEEPAVEAIIHQVLTGMSPSVDPDAHELLRNLATEDDLSGSSDSVMEADVARLLRAGQDDMPE